MRYHGELHPMTYSSIWWILVIFLQIRKNIFRLKGWRTAQGSQHYSNIKKGVTGHVSFKNALLHLGATIENCLSFTAVINSLRMWKSFCKKGYLHTNTAWGTKKFAGRGWSAIKLWAIVIEEAQSICYVWNFGLSSTLQVYFKIYYSAIKSFNLGKGFRFGKIWNRKKCSRIF